MNFTENQSARCKISLGSIFWHPFLREMPVANHVKNALSVVVVRYGNWPHACHEARSLSLGVIIDYEVRSLGERWRLRSLDEPRCHEYDAFI